MCDIKQIKVTVAPPLMWFRKDKDRQQTFKIAKYLPGMIYYDNQEINKMSAQVTLEAIVDQIKTNPAVQKRCTAIRSDIPVEDAQHIKCNGLNRMFWGEYDLTDGKFTDDSLLEHPGIMCFDIDHIGYTKAMMLKQILKDDKFCVLAFISPRGDGLKFLVRTPANKTDHVNRYKGIMRYYTKLLGCSLDGACINPARACFISHDPDPMINWNANVCLEYQEEPTRYQASSDRTSTDEETFTRALYRVESVKGKRWVDGERHTFLISLAGMCKAFNMNEDIFRDLAHEYILDDAASKSITKIFNR